MPIYEYACNLCSAEFELIQRITAPAGGTCPECGETDVRRLISLTSFRLKGTGWYVTDYGGRKNAGSNAGSNGGSSGGPEGGNDKSESSSADSSGAESSSAESSSSGGASVSKSSGEAQSSAP